MHEWINEFLKVHGRGHQGWGPHFCTRGDKSKWDRIEDLPLSCDWYINKIGKLLNAFWALRIVVPSVLRWRKEVPWTGTFHPEGKQYRHIPVDATLPAAVFSLLFFTNNHVYLACSLHQVTWARGAIEQMASSGNPMQCHPPPSVSLFVASVKLLVQFWL